MVELHATKIDAKQLKNYDLIYIYEENPGIKRVKRGRGFSFLSPNGKTIKDKTERQRLLNIAVPPTYEKVWYCPFYNGHLQATGYDSAKKKQYFYHTHWEYLREMSKFSYMQSFGQALPSFRRAIAKDLKTPQNEKEEIMAAMARILDKTGMRIGNDTASQTHKTYGLTTLRKKHVSRNQNHIDFDYAGKGGVELEKTLNDRKVAKIIEHCVEIPGQRLFQYHDRKGIKHNIDSGDLNAFIKENIGKEFSAKDFRTWRFSCLFLEEAVRQSKKADTVTLKSVLEKVAEYSGNTPSILKSSYVHPGLINIVKEKNWDILKNQKTVSGLRKSENQLLNYLTSGHAKKAMSFNESTINEK